MTDRDQQVYMLVSLWIEDNPDPEVSERLMREYTNDFSDSGFLVEELHEAIRQYRRDYQYPRRNFGFLWEKCTQIRKERLGLIEPSEAWVMVDVVHHSNMFIPAKKITLEMVLEHTPSQATAERVLSIIHKLGWKGIWTDNEAADRARFIQAYEAIDNRITNLETWKTPAGLLPEGVRSIAQLVQNIETEKENKNG